VEAVAEAFVEAEVAAAVADDGSSATDLFDLRKHRNKAA
jgi:hypothetical protein